MWTIPNRTRYEFKRSDRSRIGVWAIQRGLKDIGFPLTLDGVFGRRTRTAVESFQKTNGLYVDGIFGPQSSHALAEELARRAGLSTPLPEGLLYGLIIGESGGLICAVNWSVPGGVDVSYCQRRIYDPDLQSDAVVERAFNGLYQMDLVSRSTRGRYEDFIDEVGVTNPSVLSYIPTKEERAWRLAMLNHNWPYAAARLAAGHTLSTKTADWVPPGTKFDDGALVKTYMDWAQFYSLGAPWHDHKGSVAGYVQDWSA